MAILTRAAVAAKLAARLRGEISDAALAQWAFDQSYAYEQEQLDYEDEELIDTVLEELSFGDMPGYDVSVARLEEWQRQLMDEEQLEP